MKEYENNFQKGSASGESSAGSNDINKSNFQESYLELRTDSKLSLNEMLIDLDVADLHNKAMKIGIIKDNSQKCPCCGVAIPNSKFTMRLCFSDNEMLKFGTDCGFYFYFCQAYIRFLLIFLLLNLAIIFSLTYIITLNKTVPETIVLSIKLILEFMKEKKFFEFLIKFILVFINFFKISIEHLQKLNMLIITLLYFFFKKRFELKYIRVVVSNSDEFIDESNYGLLIKNLPIYTSKEDLKEFLQERYKTKQIREVFLLSNIKDLKLNYHKLKQMNKKLINEKNVSESEKRIHEDLQSLLLDKINLNKFFNTAIVIFEDIDDAHMFHRSYFDMEKTGVNYSKKPDYFRGNEIYFDSLPSIENINWEKIQFFKVKAKLTKVSYFSLFTILFFLIGFTLSVFAENQVLYLTPFYMIIAGEIFRIIINYCVYTLNFHDKYYEKIFISYLYSQKIALISLYILFVFSKVDSDEENPNAELSKINIIFYIIYFYLRAFTLTKLNYKYFIRKFRYLWRILILRQKVSQQKYNELNSDNEFNFILNFENFRIMIAFCLIISNFSFAIFLIMALFTIVFFYFSVYVLFSSNVSRRSKFQYYFRLIIGFEFLNILFISFFTSSMMGDEKSPYRLLSTYFVADMLKDTVKFCSMKNEPFLNKKYTDSEKHMKTFIRDKKYVNLEILRKAVEDFKLDDTYKID